MFIIQYEELLSIIEMFLVQVSQGKRSVQEMKGAFDDILAALQSSLYPIANQLVSRK